MFLRDSKGGLTSEIVGARAEASRFKDGAKQLSPKTEVVACESLHFRSGGGVCRIRKDDLDTFLWSYKIFSCI